MGAGQLPLASPKLALHRALQYAVEFWPYVMNVLEDGHLELRTTSPSRPSESSS